MFDDPDMDITRYNQLGFFNRDRVETINASNSEALFFNTSLLHSVINEVDPEGSIRVIYSFGTYRQFMENFAHMQPHIDIQQMYEAKR